MLDTIHHHGGHKPNSSGYEKLFLDILNLLIQNLPTMGQEIDKLTTEVSEAKTVQQSATTLLKSLHDRLVAAGTDKTKLAALASDLDTSSNELAAAITANTVAEDEQPSPVDPGTGNV